MGLIRRWWWVGILLLAGGWIGGVLLVGNLLGQQWGLDGGHADRAAIMAAVEQAEDPAARDAAKARIHALGNTAIDTAIDCWVELIESREGSNHVFLRSCLVDWPDQEAIRQAGIAALNDDPSPGWLMRRSFAGDDPAEIHQHWDSRCSCAVVLVGMLPTALVADDLVDLLSGPHSDRWSPASKALHRLLRDDPDGLAAWRGTVLELLDMGNRLRQRTYAAALIASWEPEPDELEEILQVLERALTADWHCRERASFAISVLGRDASPLRQILTELVRESDDHRRRCQALRSWFATEPPAEAIADLLGEVLGEALDPHDRQDLLGIWRHAAPHRDDPALAGLLVGQLASADPMASAELIDLAIAYALPAGEVVGYLQRDLAALPTDDRPERLAEHLDRLGDRDRGDLRRAWLTAVAMDRVDAATAAWATEELSGLDDPQERCLVAWIAVRGGNLTLDRLRGLRDGLAEAEGLDALDHWLAEQP